MIVLKSAGKGMEIIWMIAIITLVSFMTPGIHKINARSWGNLVLSILKTRLRITVGMIPRLDINFTYIMITIVLLILYWMKA